MYNNMWTLRSSKIISDTFLGIQNLYREVYFLKKIKYDETEIIR